MSESTDNGTGAEAGRAAVGGGAATVGLTPLAQQYLNETRPWVRFISVLTFVAAGFMLLAGLGILAVSVFGGLAE